MRAPDVVLALRERGDLWESAEGLVGLRGAALRLQRTLAGRIADHARSSSDEEWQVPAGIGFAALGRAGVLENFPQWLTTAVPPNSAGAALPSAACWQCYAALAGARVLRPRRITLEATCWRHEAGRFAALERGWAFTMREVVCLGEPAEVSDFLEAQLSAAELLARSLGLRPQIAWAEDPFFAPTARGRALSQRLKGLKRELLVPLGDGRHLAVFSANQHEAFFGEAFDLRLASSAPAWSGCAAFGLERWLLAFLVEHGVDERSWP